MFDEEEDNPGREQEEDVLREGVGGVHIPSGIHDGGHDQENEGGHDRVPTVESGPDRIDQVGEEKTDEDRRVRNVHRFSGEHEAGLLSYFESASNVACETVALLGASYNTGARLVRFT